MELQGYQSQTKGTAVQQSSGYQDGAATAQLQAAQQGTGSLLNRLETMNQTSFQQQKQLVAEKARQDAFRDAREGKEFNSQSVDTVYGRSYNEVGKATWAAKAELDLAANSNELAMEYENDPEGYKNAMGEYSKGIIENAPTPELAATAGITADKYRMSTFGKLKVAEHERFKAEALETFNQSWELNINQIVESNITGDNKTSNLLRQKNEEYLKSMVHEGILTEADAQKYMKDARFKVTYGTDIRDMEDYLEQGDLKSAKEFLDEKTSENRQDMDVDENEKYRDDLNKLYNNAVKAANAGNSELKSQANVVLGQVADAYASGVTPDPDLMRRAKELHPYASYAKQESFRIKQEAYNVIKKYDNLSLPEQEALISSLDSNDTDTQIGIEVLSQVKKMIKQRKAAAKKDPQSQGVVEGRYETLTPLSVDTPASVFLEELPRRSRNQKLNKKEYGQSSTQLFTDAEATEISAYLDSVDTSTDQKLAFIQTVNEAIPQEDVNAVYNQLRNKGALIYSTAASLVSEGKQEVARGVLEGQTLLKSLKDTDYVKDFRVTFSSKIGNALVFDNSGNDFNALVDSGVAYTLYLAKNKGDITSLKGSSERQAMTDLTNGMHKRNGQDFFLPPGVDKDDFDEWIEDDLSVDDFKDVAILTPEQALALTRGKGKIVSYGTGKYVIMQSGRRVLRKTDGTPLILEK